MSQKQVKRRRREQKSREQQELLNHDSNSYGEEQQDRIRNLEELLKGGDVDSYAQAYWSPGEQNRRTAAGRRNNNHIGAMRGTRVPQVQVPAHPAVNDEHRPVRRNNDLRRGDKNGGKKVAARRTPMLPVRTCKWMARAGGVLEVYKFRSTDRLLQDCELEEQYIFFASPDQLNDPTEGVHDMTGNSEWTNPIGFP